jgi:hypothetical protein
MVPPKCPRFTAPRWKRPARRGNHQITVPSGMTAALGTTTMPSRMW